MAQALRFPLVFACFGTVLLGLSPLFVRLSDLGPMTTAFYRMLFALPLLWLWCRYEQRKQPTNTRPIDMMIMGAAGIIFAFDLALWNWSLDHTAIVNSTLFNNTAVFFVPLIGWLLFGEKPTLRLLACVSTALVGVYMLFQESLSINFDYVFGDALALASGLMVAIYVMLIRKTRIHIPTGTLMFGTAIPSVVALAFISILFGESFFPLTSLDMVSIFCQAVLVHFLGQSVLAYAMGHLPSNQGAIALLLSPVVAAICGAFFYGEDLSSIAI